MRTIVLLAVMALLFGCGKNEGRSGNEGDSCAQTEDCEDGLRCVDSLCVSEPTDIDGSDLAHDLSGDDGETGEDVTSEVPEDDADIKSDQTSELPVDIESDQAPELPVSDADAASDIQESFSLEVVNGWGSGDYAPGTVIHVWAELSPMAEVLTSWAGDSQLLERPREWHTTLTMPTSSVTVTAGVEPRSEEPSEVPFFGATTIEKRVRYFAPPAPRGLMLLMHGTNGSSRIIDKPEGRYLALVALSRGYAVVAPEAEEVALQDPADDTRRWDVTAADTNEDLANLNLLVAEVRSRGIVGQDTPIYMVGMSNGGSASFAYGAVADTALASDFPNLQFEAVVSYCASGHGVAGITTTPTAWFLCANDDNEQVDNDQARANHAELVARGIATVLDAHPATPLYPERFTRVGADPTASRAVAQELVAAGFVGADSLFTTPTEDIRTSFDADPSAFPALSSLSGEQRGKVTDQIRVMQAEHSLYSDWAMRTIDFLDAHQP